MQRPYDPTISLLGIFSWEILVVALVIKSCPTLYNLMDCSLPGSSVPGISQARILKWVAITFSASPSHTLSLLLNSSVEFGLHDDRLLWELFVPQIFLITSHQ